MFNVSQDLVLKNCGGLLANGFAGIWETQVSETRPGAPSFPSTQTWATRLPARESRNNLSFPLFRNSSRHFLMAMVMPMAVVKR
jgi:hypothetical protein